MTCIEERDDDDKRDDDDDGDDYDDNHHEDDKGDNSYDNYHCSIFFNAKAADDYHDHPYHLYDDCHHSPHRHHDYQHHLLLLYISNVPLTTLGTAEDAAMIVMTLMITNNIASSAVPKLRMTVMITIIVASSALPRVPNATFEVYERKR